jgi:hypothetical protein
MLDTSSSERKATTIAHHAHGPIEDTQLLEPQNKTQESLSITLSSGHMMRLGAVKLRLSPETDIALDTRNPTWDTEAS